MNEYEGAWLSTSHVEKFHFLSPQPDEIDIRDIAHALSMTCRFGGHCSDYYSVGEHSLHVSKIAENAGADRVTQLAGLLHDAEEAYLPDIVAPIRHYTLDIQKIYSQIRDVIIDKYSLQKAGWKFIADVDRQLCTTEAKALKLWNKDWASTGEPLNYKLYLWVPKQAEAMFLTRFHILQGDYDK